MDLNLERQKGSCLWSTQGIGKASAFELALLGASVTLIARNEKKLAEEWSVSPTYVQQQHNYLVSDFDFPNDLKKIVSQFASTHVTHILVKNNTGGLPAGLAIEAPVEVIFKSLPESFGMQSDFGSGVGAWDEGTKVWTYYQYNIHVCQNAYPRARSIQHYSRGCSQLVENIIGRVGPLSV